MSCWCGCTPPPSTGPIAATEPLGDPTEARQRRHCHRRRLKSRHRPTALGSALTGARSGAGGNRTPVRRAVAVRATTIPEVYGSTAAAPPGRWASLGGRRRVFARGQRSSPPPAVFPAVNHRFCCRAAMVRPRVPLRVAGALVTPGLSGGEGVLLVGSCVCAPFKESEQLRSHDSASGPDVETDQPLVKQPDQPTAATTRLGAGDRGPQAERAHGRRRGSAPRPPGCGRMRAGGRQRQPWLSGRRGRR
jgi:hypothetical protein